MKIELINENQIKCTLNRADLAVHHIKLSELAYGTEKTKDLFQDMMDQAFNEFGFEASDALMIEAIPVSMDCIVLMITKVDEPEDVDQEFSGLSNIADMIMKNNDQGDDTDDLDDLIDSLSDDHFIENGIIPDHPSAPAAPSASSTAAPLKHKTPPLEKIFSFDSLETVIEFAHKSPYFKGKSSLYRSAENGRYYLVLFNTTRSIGKFGQICSLALEYGSKEISAAARSSYIKEHFETIIDCDAMSKLSEI